ncbi:MAG: hypothetical protein V3U54_03130 [Thermodesulfobacteriota bacterium]
MENSQLYLRDVGVLLYKEEKDLLKRIDRCISFQIKGLNIQITLNREFLLTTYKVVEQELIKKLLNFESVIIHLHTDQSNKFGRNNFTDQTLSVIKNLFLQSNNIDGLCIHPDLVDDFSVLERFILNDKYMGIEVLDKNVKFGNRFSDIKKILEEYDFLSLVLDTAHIQEMEEEGEPYLKQYIDFFSDRIMEMHVSRSGNYYDMDKMSKDFKTSHSLLSISNNDIIKTIYKSKVSDANYVLEGVIPYGEYGEGLLKKEVEYLKKSLFQMLPEQN